MEEGVYVYTCVNTQAHTLILPVTVAWRKKYFLATCHRLLLLCCSRCDCSIRRHTWSSFNQKQSSCSNMDFSACWVPKYANRLLAAFLQHALGPVICSSTIIHTAASFGLPALASLLAAETEPWWIIWRV